MAEAALRAQLEEGAAKLGLDLSPGQIDKLEAYLGLLGKWNKVYNLTALRDPQEMLTHHLLDSLAVVGPIRRQLSGGPARVMDVGSGAGLPGLVLGICNPEFRVTCVDAVQKKMAFVTQAATSLGLPNVKAVHARVETLTGPFDVICSRAFSSLADFVSLSRAAMGEGGVWMAMKGKEPAEELAQLPSDIHVFHVEPLQVPGLDAQRCIVWMRVANG